MELGASRNVNIEPISRAWVPEVLEFTDRQIGKGYYSRELLEKMAEQNESLNPPISYLAWNSETGNLGAVRLTLAPSSWSTDQCKTELWQVPEESVGYFKSLFVDPHYRGHGLGPLLSRKSIAGLKALGAQGVVSHCWKESPGMGSKKYLEKLGFDVIAEIPNFWALVDYDCTGCQQRPCVCTAIEMFLRLDK